MKMKWIFGNTLILLCFFVGLEACNSLECKSIIDCPKDFVCDKSKNKVSSDPGICVQKTTTTQEPKKEVTQETQQEPKKEVTQEPKKEISQEITQETISEKVPYNREKNKQDASEIVVPEEKVTEEKVTEEKVTETIFSETSENIQENNPQETVQENTTQEQATTPVGVGELVLNEILADPDTIKGDANKDGFIDASDDEFVEIVNVSPRTLDLNGVDLLVEGVTKYSLPNLQLPSKGVLVIFGGGLVGDTLVGSGKPHPKFGNAYVYIKKLTLTNSGRTLELKNQTGTILSNFTYGGTNCKGDKNQSINLSPDLAVGTCDLHSNLNLNALFSPGTKTDGSSF